MKVSLNWLKQFTDIDVPVDELVAKIGGQLGAVETVTDIGAQYKGAVIVRVVSVDKHPNADKLHVCMVDDGGVTPGAARNDQGQVQVVCGAPNVRAGMLAVWLPPGSTVPSTYEKDPFVLEARDLRGVVSNGMLASASELKISDDHDGLLEIDTETTPGMPFALAYQLDDHVIEIENKMFTHRPDCFGMLGVAREVAGITGRQFTSPQWYLEGLGRLKPGAERLPLEVRNEVPELAPRFMAVALSGLSVKPSPVLMQSYLSRLGVRPINNIVDVTNYLMLLTGQPLHAYDYDKLKALDGGDGAVIVVRNPRQNETLNLLSGKTVTPREGAVVIASGTQAIGLGGVMGGSSTEVDAATRNIVLEAATFDMFSIRRTSMAHGLFTDAVTRFTKGQSPLQNDRVLEEAAALLQSVGGAAVASDVRDLHAALPEPQPARVGIDFVNARLGLGLSTEEMKKLLENVEFDVDEHGTHLEITPPFWRTDVTAAEDVVEEVGRLYGYDRLPLNLPWRPLTPPARNGMLELKRRIRNALSAAGANEVLTYSFVHGRLLEKTGQKPERSFRLSNALSPDLQYYRQSLMPSLLDKVHGNLKAGFESFALFELNKSHVKETPADKDLPDELERLGLVLAASDKTARRLKGAAYFQAKKYLEYLLQALGVSEEVNFELITADNSRRSPYFQPGRAALVYGGDNILGEIGEFTPKVRRELKLPRYAAGFEVDLTALEGLSTGMQRYQALSKYPPVEQDITLRVEAHVTYQELHTASADALRRLTEATAEAAITAMDIYQPPDAPTKQVSFRVRVLPTVRTLTSAEVNGWLDEVAARVHQLLGAERI